MLCDVDLLLNAAGPFSATAGPLALACIATGTHYTDLGADPHVFELLLDLGERAAAAGVMILPGVGFDVVASDCLALHVAKRAEPAVRLRIALGGLALISQGSAKGLIEHAGLPTPVRRDGELVSIAPASLERVFDFGLDGRGPQPALAVSWGDVITAYHSTGVPNIEVYFEAIPAVRMMLLGNRYYGWLMSNPLSQVLLKTSTALLPEGPSDRERESREVVVVVEADTESGTTIRSRLFTPEAYTFSARAFVAVTRRILDGQAEPGFQTPAGMYGPDLPLEIDGVRREDLDDAQGPALQRTRRSSAIERTA